MKQASTNQASTNQAGTDVAKPDEAGVEDAARLASLKRQLVLRRLQQAGAGGQASLRPIGVADRSAALPMSWAQQRLWFLDRLDQAAGAAYHIPASLRLKGELDTGALQAALNRVVARHEALRTTFVERDGVLSQQIGGTDSGCRLQHHDLSDLAPEERDGQVARLAAEEAALRFDLARGPLIRARLLRLAADEHVLLLTQHHIVSDGWSIGILVREVTALYGALRLGQPDPLPPLSIQYADYSAWQRSWLQGEELEKQLGFWKTQLSGAPALLALPYDHPRPALQSYRGASVPFALSAPHTAALRQLGAAQGATLFVTLLAGWFAFLSRISGQHDLVVGTPVANRQRAEIAPLIGFFVNTLALRARLEDDPTVTDLIARVKAATQAAFAHQELPFDQVVEALRPARALSHHPVYQVVLSLNNTPGGGALSMPGLDVEPLHADGVSAHFDLSLVLSEQGGVLGGKLEYASDLFERDTAARMAACFATLLGAMAEDGARRIGALALLERARWPAQCALGAGEAMPVPTLLFHQMVESHARLQPDAPALVGEHASLSYGELNRRANGLAQRLLALGVQPDQRVAICLPRGIEMVVAMLAVLKSGAAYVPFDPAYPAARLAYMWQDSAPAALLTDTTLLARMAALDGAAGVPVLVPDDARSEANPDPRQLGLDQDKLAYIIYTSGSTGLPKGVCCRHGGLANMAALQQRTFGADAASRVLQFASFSFDASVWEIGMALAAGASLHLADAEALRPGAPLLATLHARAITHLLLPSSALAACADPDLAPPLTLVVGGDAFAPALAQRWALRHRLFNAYGPTEAAVVATLYRVAPGPRARVPIGRAVPNAQVLVLDSAMAPLPPGVVGELYIGGAGLARGYLNRPDLTEQRFVPNPFGSGRLYRSGDLGRWREDGEIEFVGRNDAQLKVRGFRIEPGEVEAALLACDGVAEALVTARSAGEGGARLVAYLRAQAGVQLDAAALRRRLQGTLAEHMVPSALVQVAQFPLTPNGKIDHAALPQPDHAALAHAPYCAPRGPIEETLARLWQQLLELEQVGRDDHFFELGGHSLLAVQLGAALQRELGVQVPLRELFQFPTLSAYALAVSAAGGAQASPIGTADRSAPLPLSWAQQRLWFLDQLDHDAGAAYHMAAALRLQGRLDRAALGASLDRIVARHESLRTCFVLHQGAPVQRILAPDTGMQLGFADLTALAAAGAQVVQQKIDAIGALEVQTHFDLATGPLVRARLLRLGTDEHLLFITQHHIVTDGWSLDLMVREFKALYAAFCQGLPDPLPPLALQYADYAAWQRGWLQGALLEQQSAYWKQALGGAPALLELPTDRSRPARQSHAGGRIAFCVPAELAAGLRALGRATGTTLHMTVLAAWSILLARLSNQRDIVVGTPVANRQRSETEALIGFFINTLALRVRFEDNPSLRDLLVAIRSTSLEAYAHQDLPFEQVVEALNPQRSLDHSPLFQTTLTVNASVPGAELALPGLAITPIEQARNTTQFDLALILTDTGDTLAASITYASDLFDQATVQRWCGHFLTLLDNMLADPDCGVLQLALLEPAERAQLVRGFNDSASEYPRDGLVHARFEQLAAAHPQAPALGGSSGEPGSVEPGDAELSGGELSYAELNERANRLAHYLRGAGVRRGSRVAVCLPRGAGMIVAMLAILKAGGAYVPLDPAYPEQRRSFMLDDCAPLALLTSAALEQDMPASGLLRVVVLDGADRARIAAQPGTNLAPTEPALQAGDLAYVIYTSGSSGQPKGVMITHRNVLRLAVNSGFAPLGAGDCVAHCASPAFDAATWEIWAALLNGARVSIVSHDDVLDARRLNAALVGGGVTAMWLTVGLFNEYVDQLGDAFSGLRYLLIGGDALDPVTVARLLASPLRPQHLINGYGPTESTTFAATGRIDAVAPQARSIPLGAPIANTQVYVLDEFLQPVPLGVAGELHIGGDGVGRGYLNRPDLTAERFIEDHLGAHPGGQLFKTGDLGCWRADGRLDFLGRNDFQVKIRGYRIELGEIEARLRTFPLVQEALVMARADQLGTAEKRLVAYLVAQADAQLDTAALRRQLGAALPEYMLPAAFVVLDAFPLTANGKLDRRALPAPDAAALALRDYQAPQGPIEQAVAALWQDLLGVPKVGRHDHFFELGGHSLLAVQLVSALRRELGREVALRDLFDQPQLEAFAAVLGGAAPAALGSIEPADRNAALPLSFAQQRLWFLDRLDSAAGAAYHIPAALRLRGHLDTSALRAALNRIVERHESLRTSFIEADGRPLQSIAPAVQVALPERDLCHLQGQEQAAMVRTLAQEQASAPFSLACAPLMRVLLVRLSSSEHVLLFTQHHIISDGWSMGILADEVCTLYAAFSSGQPDPLPPLTLQYADYAAWQAGWLQGERLAAQLAFWRQHLQGAPALLALPSERARPALQSYAGNHLGFELDAELCDALRALSQRHGTTLFMTLLAGWGILLARLAGQDDLVIGTPVANRQRSEVETLIGFFVNTLALRIDLRDDPSVAELLARVRENTLRAFEHQELPFEQVVEAINPERSMGHSPLFQVTLAWNNTPPGRVLTLPGLEIAPLELEHRSTHFDLSLALGEEGAAIRGTLEYASDLFEHASMERLVGQLLTVLRGMCVHEQMTVGRLPLLTAHERARLLSQAAPRPGAAPDPEPLHRLFERQAASRADALAIVDGAERLSYGQLNARANRLAERLAALGVGSDDRVALYLERGSGMVVAMLAVLKAGGAYVPIDPSYPRERVAYMLADSAPLAILSQESLRARLPDSAVPVLTVQAESSACNPRAAAGASNLACVLYTSGSTGQPKGIMLEHRNLVRLSCDTDYLSLGPDDVVAQASNVSFDAASFEIWGALLNGARLVMVERESLLTPDCLAAQIEADGIGVLFVTTALFNRIAQQAPAIFKPLRALLFGGEAVSCAAVEAVARHGMPGQLLHLYGPAENTTFSTWHRIDAGYRAEQGMVPIGAACCATALYVLDPAGEPVPPGVVGELYLGGAGLARGYLGRAALSAEKFIANPFGAGRLYRSGDLVRWNARAQLEYVGRNDFQVKIRGFRIEPGEIEALLRAQDGVRDALVLARPDAAGEKQLVGYVLGQPDCTPDLAQLRAALAAGVAPFMVPAALMLLDAWPLTANGKVDRNALPAPDLAARQAPAYRAPASVQERVLAQIWQQLLGIERVGRDDDFFALGGHSLLAVQVLSALRRELGVELPLRTMFAEPVLWRLAAAVARGGAPSSLPAGQDAASVLVPIRTAGALAPLFLVHPGEGEVAYAHTLAALLDPALPVYGLAARGFLEGETPLETVPQMATLYLQALRAVQPHGPYRLAGWSAGGTIAYEMAHQLRGAGEQVAFLGLIDTTSSYSDIEADGFDQAQVLRLWLPAELPQALRAPLEMALTRKDVAGAVTLAQAAGLMPQDVPAAALLRHLAVRHALVLALHRYALPAAPARLSLFTADGTGRADPTMGWGALAGAALAWTPVGGTHASIVKPPHAARLAAAIGRALDGCVAMSET